MEIKTSTLGVELDIHPIFYSLDSDKVITLYNDFLTKLEKEIKSLDTVGYTISKINTTISCLETLAIIDANIHIDIACFTPNETDEPQDLIKVLKSAVKKTDKLYNKFIEKMEKNLKDNDDKILRENSAQLRKFSFVL